MRNVALDITEKEWDAQLFHPKRGLATQLGWTLTYHTLRSKGSRSGFPDRVLIRERIIYAELKKETGKVTETQREFLDGLAAAGGEVYEWRPSDLDEIARVLSKKWNWEGWSRRLHIPNGHSAINGADNWWTPGSLWIPGQGRYDNAQLPAA